MKKSGLAHSPFFEVPAQEKVIHQARSSVQQAASVPKKQTKLKAPGSGSMTPRYRDTTIPSNHDTVIPPAMSSCHHDTIQQVRKSVKEIGKEAATHRFTAQEKRALAELIYTYRQKGIKTSENEIARIALNWLMIDYQTRGSKSILAEVLRKANQ